MLTVCALASLLFCNALGTGVMRAQFKNSESGVIGNVTVKDSGITLDLNLTEIRRNGNLPAGCNATAGFLFHVHSNWSNINNESHYGEHCNKTFVGGHYDPFGACSSKSANSYCKSNGGCINTTYSCTTATYAANRFSCEVGDWSGKYGTLKLNSNNMTSASVGSFGDITGNSLVKKSIVFHCANNLKPAFCAPFLPAAGTVGSTTSQRQANGYTLTANFSTAKEANPKKNSYITVDYTGAIKFQFDKNAFTGYTPCSSGLADIWIGDAWTDGTLVAQSTCNSSLYGNFYDPTNQCYPGSNKTDCIFCKKGKLCGATLSTYDYSCDYTQNPFSCSPMDFSGRYGVLDLTTLTSTAYSLSTTDRYLTDLTHLVHKSVVLVCTSSQKPLFCAKWQNVGVGVSQASFSALNSGGQGSVTVRDGQVTVQVAFEVAKSKYLNGTLLPTNCFDAGLKAHIHEMWTYDDSIDRVGPEACGATYTGGHWDPWMACSKSSSDSGICKSSTPTSSPTTACISIGGSAGNGQYICNSTNYITDPFTCEVADWSGKYGVYSVLGNSSQVTRSDASYLEVDATDLVGRAIVFHCANSDTRAFCAPFILQGGTDGGDAQPTWALNSQAGNLIYNATVVSSWGSILLQNTGYFYVDIDYSNSTCSSGATLGYGVFQDSACKDMYDPTVQCIPNSQYNGTLCLDQKTCDVSTALYDCQFSTTPYSCSPSDLSGKYGATSTSKQLLVSGWDDLMIPLAQLRTKYFGFYCSDTWKTAQCHPWTVDVQVTKNPTTSPTHKPTYVPTAHPTKKPTKPPTKPPTKSPTKPPTKPPTHHPSQTPTISPSSMPTLTPTDPPTEQPSLPTQNPTHIPTQVPTDRKSVV